jgi:hypothetical protein
MQINGRVIRRRVFMTGGNPLLNFGAKWLGSTACGLSLFFKRPADGLI